MKDLREAMKFTFGLGFLVGGMLIMFLPGAIWGNADVGRICGAIFAAAGLITIFC